MPATISPWPSGDKEPEEVEISPNGRYIRYNILLGKGACKRVYKALDTKKGLEVAWNQVELLGMDRDEEARQHLQEEIRVLQKLKHKNIMTFYAWWYDDTHQHINFITELFTAGNLRQYRKKLKIMSENVLKRWAHQILEGLLYLHGHTPPIVHRDLKCDNIFVNSATGEVKIGDLGLATVQQTAMSVVGTPEFMAPEVYDETYDERCDIYSFGMCLLELATLEYPYSECHSVPQIFKKVTLGIPPASLARVSSPELRDFIALCIAHNPADRPCARELLKHPYLEAVRGQLTGSESFGSLPAAGSVLSVNLAPVGGGNSGPGTGWNTPSGTLHCAASVRDLREALHQQETLARHLQQQQQQQLLLNSTSLVHHGATTGSTTLSHPTLQAPQPGHPHGQTDSCPLGELPFGHPHPDPTAAAAAHPPAPAPTPMQRSLTGLLVAPPPPGLSPVLIRSPSVPVVPSPLGRRSASPCSPAGADPAAAVAAGGGGLASSPRLSPPSPLGRAAAGAGGGGGGSPVGAGSEGPAGEGRMATTGLMDSLTDDSDEEVLVPIEVVKAGLLQEGFVDTEAEMFSEPSEAGSDPSVLTLVDPAMITNGVLTSPALRTHSDPRGTRPRSRRQRKAAARRVQLLRSGTGLAAGCEPIREGEGDAPEGEDEDGDGEADQAGEEGCEQDEEGEGEEEEGEEPSDTFDEEEDSGRIFADDLGQPKRSDPSIDLNPIAQMTSYTRHLRHTVAAAASPVSANASAAVPAAAGPTGGASAAAAAQTPARIPPGQESTVGGGCSRQPAAASAGVEPETEVETDASGSVDQPLPSLACSLSSSASSTARLQARSSADSASGGGAAGPGSTGTRGSAGGAPGAGSSACHSRSDSADGVVFKVNYQGPSGASTPALRMSYSGIPLPYMPPMPAAAPPTAAGAATFSTPQTHHNHHLLVRSATMSACEASSPAAPYSAPPHQQQHQMGASIRGPPGAAVPGGVRLPSFRNKVLLTLTQQQHGPTPLTGASNLGDAAPGGGSAGDRGGGPDSAGESPVRFLRTTSARTIGGFRLTDAPASSIAGPARQPAWARTWGGTGLQRDRAGSAPVAAAGSGAEGPDSRSTPLLTLAAVPEGDGTGGGGGSSGNLAAVAAALTAPIADASTQAGGSSGSSSGRNSGRSSEMGADAELPGASAGATRPDTELGDPEEPAAAEAVGLEDGESGPSLLDAPAYTTTSAVPPASAPLPSAPWSAPIRSSAPGTIPAAPAAGARFSSPPRTQPAPRLSEGSNRAGAAASATAATAAATLSPVLASSSGVGSEPFKGIMIQVGGVTVVREYARPIQGVIMRLKQFRRLVRDRAKALRS